VSMPSRGSQAVGLLSSLDTTAATFLRSTPATTTQCSSQLAVGCHFKIPRSPPSHNFIRELDNDSDPAVNLILFGGSTEMISCSIANTDLVSWNASMPPLSHRFLRHLRGACHGHTAKLGKFEYLMPRRIYPSLE
jgi:hypothetical protein